MKEGQAAGDSFITGRGGLLGYKLAYSDSLQAVKANLRMKWGVISTRTTVGPIWYVRSGRRPGLAVLEYFSQ